MEKGKKNKLYVTSIDTNSIFFLISYLASIILSYISQQRSHALCDLIKIEARLTVKLGSYMTFMEVKTLIRQIDIPAFPAFTF